MWAWGLPPEKPGGARPAWSIVGTSLSPAPLPRSQLHCGQCQQVAQRREDKMLQGQTGKDSARPGPYRTHPPRLIQRPLRQS